MEQEGLSHAEGGVDGPVWAFTLVFMVGFSRGGEEGEDGEGLRWILRFELAFNCFQ